MRCLAALSLTLSVLAGNPSVAAAASQACHVFLEGVPFETEVVNALHRATPFYRVIPMAGMLDGRQRVVFVVEETASESRDAQARGEDLLKSFSLRGIERVGAREQKFIKRYLRTALRLSTGNVRRAVPFVVANGAGETINIALDFERRLKATDEDGQEVVMLEEEGEGAAGKVVRALREYPGVSSMLVVVSRGKSKALLAQLQNEHGFERTELPAPSSYLGLDRLTGEEAALRVLEIAQRRGRAKSYVSIVGGRPRFVTLLKRDGKSHKSDSIERALAPYYDATAGERFDGKKLSAISASSALLNGLRIFGIDRDKLDPVTRLENDFIQRMGTLSELWRAPGALKSFSFSAGYRRGLADNAQLVLLSLWQAGAIGFYGMAAYYRSIPEHQVAKAIFWTLYVAPELFKDYVAAEVLLNFKYRDSAWYKRLFPAMTVSLERRSETNEVNFRKRFIEDPRLDSILISMHGLYLADMEEIVRKEGFEPVESHSELFGGR